MAEKRDKPNAGQLALLRALRAGGRSKPIDAHERAHGKVPPASRGGVAAAAARELRQLMSQGYVNAAYWDATEDRAVGYALTPEGFRQAQP